MARIFAALGLALMMHGTATAASGEATDALPPDKWPTSVSAVVADLARRLPEPERERLRLTPRKDLIQFHHGLGTGIRNYYGLWRGNDKLIASACGRQCHPDDASMIIIEALWQSLQKSPHR